MRHSYYRSVAEAAATVANGRMFSVDKIIVIIIISHIPLSEPYS